MFMILSSSNFESSSSAQHLRHVGWESDNIHGMDVTKQNLECMSPHLLVSPVEEVCGPQMLIFFLREGFTSSLTVSISGELLPLSSSQTGLAIMCKP